VSSATQLSLQNQLRGGEQRREISWGSYMNEEREEREKKHQNFARSIGKGHEGLYPGTHHEY